MPTQYSIDRVFEIAEAARAYAEDHLDFLREDAQCDTVFPGLDCITLCQLIAFDYKIDVAEHISDRLPNSLFADLINTDYCAKEEAIELFLTGYTRQVRSFSSQSCI